jgi:hypothetical protein
MNLYELNIRWQVLNDTCEVVDILQNE